jgi:hypothetical protein
MPIPSRKQTASLHNMQIFAGLQRYLQRRAGSVPLNGPSFCMAFCLLSSNTQILHRFTYFL